MTTDSPFLILEAPRPCDTLAWELIEAVEAERWGLWMGPQWQSLWAD